MAAETAVAAVLSTEADAVDAESYRARARRPRSMLPLSVVPCTDGHVLVGRFMGQCIPLESGELEQAYQELRRARRAAWPIVGWVVRVSHDDFPDEHDYIGEAIDGGFSTDRRLAREFSDPKAARAAIRITSSKRVAQPERYTILRVRRKP